MDRKYNLKLDLQFRCNNSIMFFRESDKNTSDFFMQITRGGNLIDIENATVILAVIKPNNVVQSQVLEIKNGKIYANLNNNMKDLVGVYKAQALLILNDERISTDVIKYEVLEDDILNQLDNEVTSEENENILLYILSKLSELDVRVSSLEKNGVEGDGDTSISIDLSKYVTKLELDKVIKEIELTPGPKGEHGEQGERGLQGIQGVRGEKGDKGDKGEKGDTPSITHLEKQVSDKSKELDIKFETLANKQQQNEEVVTARDGEVSLNARLERDLENIFDQLAISTGNINAEIATARIKEDGTTYSTLGDRLNQVDSQLTHIANKGPTVEVLERVVKEEIDRQIQDGTIANLTIMDGSLDIDKTSYYKTYNLNILNVNDEEGLIDKDFEWTGVLFESSGGTVYDVPIIPNKTYYFDKTVFNPSSYYGVFLDSSKNYLGQTTVGQFGGATTFICENKDVKYIRVRVNNSKKETAYISEVDNYKYSPYGSMLYKIDDSYNEIFLQMYSNLLEDVFSKAENLKLLEQELNDKINTLNEKILSISNGIDDMYLLTGNKYEHHPVNFKSGYIYELIPACDWNNLSDKVVYDCTGDGIQANLKGVYNIKTYKDGFKVLPSCDYVNTHGYAITNNIKGKNDILFIGDSLTDTGFQTFYCNYVSKLYDKYKGAYNFIPNLATFGHTTKQQLSAFKNHIGAMNTYFNEYYSVNNIKYISIFLGTNDIGQDTPIFEFEKYYIELIEYIQTNISDCKILLITPSLCYKKPVNINYINKIKEIALNKNLEVVDLSSFDQLNSVKNGKNEYYMEEDCIHFTELGWELINSEIIKGFENLGVSF